MAIKNYVVKNKRKSTCIFVMLLFLVASMFVVFHTNNTNAGVYIEDEDGKYKQIYEIKVLEIVAQNGQQVIGYTVKGQEPITVEKIEEYTGTADLTSTDFKNATGFNVIKNTSTNRFEVESSVLNTSFNDNILGESMADGEIVVKAVQANELTTADIDWADLIYINSNDSNSNLLYYYDQIMCDGAMGIAAGDMGMSYNDTMISTSLRKDIAVKVIGTSAGLDNIETTVTKQIFSYLGSENYYEDYYEEYIENLEALEYESLKADSLEEIYTNVDNLLISVNKSIKDSAYETIFSTTKQNDGFTEEEKNNIIEALSNGKYEGYNPLNNEEYCESLTTYTMGILEPQISDMLLSVNGSKELESLNKLVLMKNKVIEAVSLGNINDVVAGTDEYGLTTSDYEMLSNCFMTINVDSVKEELISDYINAFIDENFVYTESDSDKIKELVNEVNDYTINEVILPEIYNCIGNVDVVTVFAEEAEEKFAILDATGYNPYNCQEYIDALTTIEDTDADGKISIEEFETYVSKINNEEIEVTNSYDIKWKVAEYMYSSVGAEEVALMYNSQLLTNKTLGDYTLDMSESGTSVDNRNNMYKMLLLIRQIRYDYYKDNIKSLIDTNGLYYKEGYNSAEDLFIGVGADSWNMYTFREGDTNDFDNYAKYREPDVVGDTYTSSGTKGLNTNYVQDRVYSYTGEQFFGGENFVSLTDSDVANFKSKNTATIDSALASDAVLTNQTELVGKSKGDVIRYLLEVSLMQLDSPLRVLEIQPAANTTVLDTEAAKKKILNYMSLDLSTDMIDVTTMSIKEFNTRNEDLISNYDLIYFGTDSGYLTVNKYNNNKVTRTRYNDDSMTGLVYTGIGDLYQIQDFLRGTAAIDYYQNNYVDLGKTLFATITTSDGKYLYASNGNNGTQVKKSSTSVQWRFYRYDDGSYEIKRVNESGKCLDVNNGTSTAGEKVQLWSANSSNAQKWYIYPIGETAADGFYLVPKCATGCALTINSSNNAVTGKLTKDSTQIFYITGSSIQSSATTTTDEEYDYWLNNFTGAFKNNVSVFGEDYSSWDLPSTNSRWYLKSTSSEIATTRLTGNDLTVKRMEDLLAYVKAGYPIMLPDEIYNCDSDYYIDYETDTTAYSKWRYVDVNSKMYNFITTIKKLGYDETQGKYTGLDSSGNKVFDDGYKYANIIIDDEQYAKYGRNPENLPEEEKFEGGMTYAIKRSARVDFELISCPTEYNKNLNPDGTKTDVAAGEIGNIIEKTKADGSENPEYYTYEYQLKLNSSSRSLDWVKENYSFKICIDKSGTGRFEDMYIIELEPEVTFDTENDIVKLTGNWPGNMDGFMPWKVLAYSNSNPNSSYSYTGFSAFRIETVKDVYVLWVRTNDKNTLTLNFASLVDSCQDEMKDAGLLEYNIKLIEITNEEFVNMWNGESSTTSYNKNNSLLTVKNVRNKCNEKTYTNTNGIYLGDFSSFDKASTEDVEFNMIVFGYCDSYPGLEVDSIAAQNNMQYFIDAGRSILYVHDNSSYLTTLNYYTGPNSIVSIPNSWDWGRYNTAFLRDTLGMDAYGITYSPSVFDVNSADYQEDIANTRKYINSNNQEDYRGITEVCVFKYEYANAANDIKTGNDTYTDNKYSTTPKSITDWQYTFDVEQVNKGQISEYPYVIGESLNVKKTHTQYTTLNMEDEELTVWYTLGYKENSSDSTYYKHTKGDGANNYYIYSKGNITYTGAGHSNEGGTCMVEQKLFFNTVIASIKAGNFEPTVEFPDAQVNSEGKYIAYHVDDEDVIISFKAVDFDGQKGTTGSFTSSKIYIDIDGVEGYSTTDLLLYDYESDSTTSVVLNPNNYDAVMGNELKGENLINGEKYSFKLSNAWINSNKVISGKSIYECPIVVEVTDSGSKDNTNDKTTVNNKIYLQRIENIKSSLFELD